MQSAFGSAGQRCSACRILYVQEDVFDKTILMLQGAMAELNLGNPADIATDIGPLVDEQAYRHVAHHKVRLEGVGNIIAQAPIKEELVNQGNFFQPLAVQIDSLDILQKEIFGPVLHVISYKSDEIQQVIDCLLYTSPSPRDGLLSRMPSSA